MLSIKTWYIPAGIACSELEAEKLYKMGVGSLPLLITKTNYVFGRLNFL